MTAPRFSGSSTLQLSPPQDRPQAVSFSEYRHTAAARRWDQAAHVVGEVLQPDPRLRPHQPDTTHQRPAHVVALGPEDIRRGKIPEILDSVEQLLGVNLIVWAMECFRKKGEIWPPIAR